MTYLGKFRIGALSTAIVSALWLVPAPLTASGVPAPSCAREDSIYGHVGERGVTAGSLVRIYSDDIEAATRPGDVVRPQLLGEGRTDAVGCYTIALAAAQQWIDATDRAGTLTVRVVVTAPDRTLTTTVPIALAASQGAPEIHRSDTRLAPKAQVVAALTSSGGRLTGDLRVNFDPRESASAAGAATERDATAATEYVTIPSPAVAATCTGGTRWKLLKRYGNRRVVVGQWWSSTRSTSQTWEYGEGTSTRIGAAWSLSGKVGSFEGSKEWSDSVDASVTFPVINHKARTKFFSYFRYGKYAFQTRNYCSGKWITNSVWVRQSAWVRGATTGRAGRVPRQTNPVNWCSEYRKGAKDYTAVSTAMTWEQGVSMNPAMQGLLGNVKLSSRTGFTRSARNFVKFKFGPGRLCGRKGDLSKPGALIGRSLP